jgi:hypothetical protein
VDPSFAERINYKTLVRSGACRAALAGTIVQPIHEGKRRAAFRELGEIEGADRSRRNHALAERFDYKKGRLLNE